jgi:hypothetical protein
MPVFYFRHVMVTTTLDPCRQYFFYFSYNHFNHVTVQKTRCCDNSQNKENLKDLKPKARVILRHFLPLYFLLGLVRVKKGKIIIIVM